MPTAVVKKERRKQRTQEDGIQKVGDGNKLLQPPRPHNKDIENMSSYHSE